MLPHYEGLEDWFNTSDCEALPAFGVGDLV
jgi:hypothetical protein